MGVIESIRGVLWARKRQPTDIPYVAALAHERFTPRPSCWSRRPANSGNAWVWLGAASQVTKEVSLGPAVTAITYRRESRAIGGFLVQPRGG